MHPDQRYFSLVVTLGAIHSDGVVHLHSLRSTNLVVRASNPGKFTAEKPVLDFHRNTNALDTPSTHDCSRSSSTAVDTVVDRKPVGVGSDSHTDLAMSGNIPISMVCPSRWVLLCVQRALLLQAA